MKFNWGTGIFLLYGGFAVIVLALVAFAMTKKVDLVTDNYYDKELKYEETIQQQKNLNSLDEKLKVEFSTDSVKVKFPLVFSKDSIKGSFHFYRPSDSGKDVEITISPDLNNEQVINTSKFLKGMWKLKISWIYNGAGYYDEKSFFIQ